MRIIRSDKIRSDLKDLFNAIKFKHDLKFEQESKLVGLNSAPTNSNSNLTNNCIFF